VNKQESKRATPTTEPAKSECKSDANRFYGEFDDVRGRCASTIELLPGDVGLLRLPGVNPKRSASCADLRRREMDNIDKRNAAPKAPTKPRLRRNGSIVSREQIESVTTNTKIATIVNSDKPCPACGPQPPRAAHFAIRLTIES